MTQKTKETVLAGILFCSVLLFIYSIDLYRETMINWKILLLPSVIGALIFALLFYKTFYSRTYTKAGTIFFCLICGAGITNYVFLKKNQLFAGRDTISENFAIEEQGTMGRFDQPYAVINFHGMKKQIVFEKSSVEPKKRYVLVHLDYSKGLFGFPVVSSKRMQ